ncbi:hypothetical protein K1T71_014046 [Dendrolimus kikuchii]|uniref:Uncharacterized protein n=1 Tax=Dendrolimus kikuchii TaxID=765133 RepID=A0ACC1CEV3_9NEOP|nr:hypothetical protein K1T71_014046 [Dendrolimus kikuchii]
MEEPQKPFACTVPDCGMAFTNEDHLHVHKRKHDMALQFGLEQKGAFVADQTPTPTRFIRNCEEVGLFQDLQNVNPFDEGFKRAMDAKHSILSLENAIASSSGEELHTPQMMFPVIDAADSTLFSTTNNQRNITISRSSSDESGAIKEFETTTISKLTNEVTTISRIVEKHDDQSKNDAYNRDNQKKDSVSYTNNVIKIHSNVEIRKENDPKNPIQTLIYEDTVIKDGNIITKDVLLNDNKLNVPVPPMMSQKSIDFVVDSLTTDLCCDNNHNKKADSDKTDNYEVIIKLPNGRQVRMKSVEEINSNYQEHVNAKEKLKKAITDKQKPVVQNVPIVPNIVPITGTLIPVTLVNPILPKIPIVPLKADKTGMKRKKSINDCKIPVLSDRSKQSDAKINGQEPCQRDFGKDMLESRSAASRRYRARLKEAWHRQAREIIELKELNERLKLEKAALKVLITEHMRTCPNADDLRSIKEKLKL